MCLATLSSLSSLKVETFGYAGFYGHKLRTLRTPLFNFNMRLSQMYLSN